MYAEIFTDQRHRVSRDRRPIAVPKAKTTLHGLIRTVFDGKIDFSAGASRKKNNLNRAPLAACRSRASGLVNKITKLFTLLFAVVLRIHVVY